MSSQVITIVELADRLFKYRLNPVSMASSYKVCRVMADAVRLVTSIHSQCSSYLGSLSSTLMFAGSYMISVMTALPTS